MKTRNQRLFGSQRAMKSVEDFTEFEQRAAYFDGDPVQAQRKGVNILERGSQVHFTAEVQDLLDFPPAPKLDLLGKLDPGKATESERRGQALFFGKAQCATEPHARALVSRVASWSGFSVTHHRIELYGRCVACRKKRAGRARRPPS